MSGKRVARMLVVGIAVLVIAFGAVTFYALESSDVAVVETRRADGSLRRTHVWYVEAEDGLWLEAGTPRNGWFVDVGSDPRLHLSADGRSGDYRAEPVRSPEAHARLRERLRARYGWRDAWVSIYVDQGGSVAVHLAPEP